MINVISKKVAGMLCSLQSSRILLSKFCQELFFKIQYVSEIIDSPQNRLLEAKLHPLEFFLEKKICEDSQIIQF
jgi:hypothetical protein